MRTWLIVGIATAVTAAMLLWASTTFGARSLGFAFVVVWLPMVALGTVSHAVPVRLPDRWHDLRQFERGGRIYERFGVRVAKRILRRGPLAVFNPKLHLPADRTPAGITRLDRAMRTAEATHLILFLATLGVVVHAATRGWWGAAACTLLFDALFNGYPVMLQRYNRVLLERRFGAAGPSPTAS